MKLDPHGFFFGSPLHLTPMHSHLSRYWLVALAVVLLGSTALIVPWEGVAGAQDYNYETEPPEGYARLLVITNFDESEVRINDVAYPYEWIYGGSEGLFLPADFPFEVVIATSEEHSRTFRLNLQEGETRVLVVDIRRAR